MAEQSAQDVVTQSQSVGDLSPSDAPATTTTTEFNQAGEVTSVEEVLLAKENGIHVPATDKLEEFEDASARSDTDTSRADGSVTDDKQTEAKPTVKKFAPKPVSFAKYSVPRVIAANAAAKPTDRGMPAPQSMSNQSLIVSSSHTELVHFVSTADRQTEISCEGCQLIAAKGPNVQACCSGSIAGLE